MLPQDAARNGEQGGMDVWETRKARHPSVKPGRMGQKCTSKGTGRQGIVSKPRSSLQKSPCPVVICPYLRSSEWGGTAGEALQEHLLEHHDPHLRRLGWPSHLKASAHLDAELRPISLLTLSLLRLLDSNFAGNPRWAWELHPFELRLCLSQTL